MTRRLLDQRAATMVLWYESQPDHATMLTDSEIAERLAAVAPSEGWTNRVGQGNVKLVRSIRGWVDRQTTGDFADRYFGTRSTRRAVSHLRTGPEVLDETMIGAAGQAVATEDRTRRDMETRARESMKWEAQAHAFGHQNETARAFTCHDAANEIEQFGILSPKTRAMLKMYGLL